MYKTLSLVLTFFILSFSTAFAEQALHLHTSELVRAKLWHDGIHKVLDFKQVALEKYNYPEELRIAVEILDAEERK